MIMPLVCLVRQYLAAAFLIVIGATAAGCGDSATVNPAVELASLRVTPGKLQPAFSGATTQYRVDVTTDISSVRVTAQPAVPGDTLTINGQATTSRDISLEPPGSTTPVSIVVSESGTKSRTYTVLLVRAGLTGNNSLENLALSPGTLAPAFDANIQDYTVDVANNVGSVTVTPTLSDPAAAMSVNGQAATSGQGHSIALNGAGSNTVINILVTAQNGSTKPYSVMVSRGISGNNNLRNLTVSQGALDPSFSTSTTDYRVNVGSSVGNIVVTPTVQDATASMTVNGQAAASGQGRSIALNGGGSNTVINILVTAQNGTQQTYSMNVIRAALGGNNNLQSLTVSPGTLAPAFRANTTNYTVGVASSATSVTVTPRLQDTTASMTVNGQTTTSGSARTIPLNGAGSNTVINIVVTAPNGNSKTYSTNVARAALGANNNLRSLTVSQGTLNPAFSANTTNYTVDVGSGVTSITVTPTLQDTTASMTVNGQVTTSGGARTIPLNGAGSNTAVNIVVIAPNGNSKPYTITAERAALGGNNNLRSLTVSPGTLAPAFRANRTGYSVNLGSTVDNLTVTATLEDAGATLTINGQGASSGQSRPISLGPPGSTTEIDITVVAPNGNPRAYQIDVNREALGGNNNLQNLTLSPSPLNPGFNANTTTYTVNVGSSVTSVTVTATLQDANATMTIEGQGTSSGQRRSISLGAAGTSTDIDILVTAPNGNDKTTTITVNRAAPTVPPAPASAPDLTPESDSGFLPGQDADNITNDLTPSFTVAPLAAGETPNLYIDGVKVKEGFDQGANTLTPTNPLPGGEFDITVTSTVSNAAGVESPPSPSLTVHIDNVAPGFP